MSFLLVAAAVGVASSGGPAWARAAAALALVAAASVASRVVGRRRSPPRGWVILDDRGVRRVEDGVDARLADWSEPFGVTVLSTADRASFVLAFTTPHSARYVGARAADVREAAATPALLERATTAADADVRVEADAVLSAGDAEALLAAVERRAPASLDRVYLSSPGGEAVVLEAGALRVGGRCIDLRAPLEWRASVFQERGSQCACVCQATWVRQGDAELVLVASLPGEGASPRDAAASIRAAGAAAATTAAVVKRAAARDLRLMQATAGEPPPRELRCAIDRVFMLPLRRALDRAPRLDRPRAAALASPPR